MTKTERNWILYDVANSAFTLIVISSIGQFFFKGVISQGVDNAISTSNWAFANSLASMIVAVLAPILGAFADYRGVKKRLFVTFLCIGILFTLLMSSVGVGQWLWFLIVYVVARTGYAGANVFYDSFLVDVTEKDRMDWISSSGFAWGYIGSVIPYLAAGGLIFIEMSRTGSETLPNFTGRIAFLIVVAWWSVLSVPMLRHVRQKYCLEPGSHPIRDSFARLGKTFREIRKYRQAFMFLAAYFFYIDGIDTIITMFSSYGIDNNLNIMILFLVTLMTQVVAFPCALLYGKMAGRFSARNMLYVGIGIYVCITFVAFYLPDMSRELTVVMFFVLAFLAATSLGGIQALSRSIFARLIPADRSAEFFGFYNIFGKFATVLGPTLMGIATRMMGHSRYGVLSVLLLFVIGGILLLRVEKNPH